MELCHALIFRTSHLLRPQQKDRFFMIFRSEQHQWDRSANSSSQAPGIDRADLLTMEADVLRRKAKKLMAEALEMEADVKESIASKAKKRKDDSSDLIERIFESGRPLTADAVAYAMRNTRVSGDQAMSMLEHLFQKLWDLDYRLASELDKLEPIALSNSKVFSESEINEPAQIIINRLACLIDAAEILDQTINEDSRSRWSGRVASALKSGLAHLRIANAAKRDLVEKQLVAGQLRQDKSYNKFIIGGGPGRPVAQPQVNYTKPELVAKPARISYFDWLRIPRQIRQLWNIETNANNTISSRDIVEIQTKVLNGTQFLWNSTDKIASNAAYFRGRIDYGVNLSATTSNLTVQDSGTADLFQELDSRMEKEGLNDRVNLFLLQDPNHSSVVGNFLRKPTSSGLTSMNNPVILAVPVSVKPEPRRENAVTGALRKLLLAWPVLTLFSFSVRSFALNPSFFSAIVQRRDARVLSVCAPIILGVVAIQAVHEFAHWWMAKRRGILIGWPFPVPSFELGTFGCITALNSFPANRTDMFDFSMSGPMAAAISSLVCMFIGVYRTIHASSQAISNFPTLPVAWFKSSFLSGAILSLLAPKIMALPLSQPIPIHPLFVVGFSGLLSSALNMLPVTRLDGGRAATAAMGKYGEVASAFTFLFVLISLVSKESASTLLWSWVMFIILFQRKPEILSRDNYTEINDLRLNLWMLSVVFSVLALVPFPGFRSTPALQ